MEMEPCNLRELWRSTPEWLPIGERILPSRSARLRRQSVWAGHQHGCGGFVLEPVTPGPKKDTDNHFGTHRQPSRDKYLRPEPGEFQPAAKQKHVGEPNYSGEEAQQAAPSGCLPQAEFVWLPGARPAQALVDGGYASALTVLRRRVMGDLSQPCRCVMTSEAQEAELQPTSQLRLCGSASAFDDCVANAICLSPHIRIKMPWLSRAK